jgi:hypothetical protein
MPAAWKRGVRGPAARMGFPHVDDLLPALDGLAPFVRTAHQSGWVDPELGGFLPPFRRVYVISRTNH